MYKKLIFYEYKLFNEIALKKEMLIGMKYVFSMRKYDSNKKRK
jgi:hypothetical protein